MMIDRHIIQTGDKKFAVYAGRSAFLNDMNETMKFVNEVTTWCKETYGNEYETWDFKSIRCLLVFDKIEDAVAFKLRWI